MDRLQILQGDITKLAVDAIVNDKIILCCYSAADYARYLELAERAI